MKKLMLLVAARAARGSSCTRGEAHHTRLQWQRGVSRGARPCREAHGANAQAHVGDHGHVVVRLNAETLKVCWSYSNLKLTPLGAASATPTASHIHTGAAGVNGAVLVPFGATSFERKGCTTTTNAIIDGILANPSGYYVNVHNASYPGGAIRGQLKEALRPDARNDGCGG